MKRHLVLMLVVLLGLILSGLSGFSSISLAAEGKWTRKADMPTPRWEFSTSSVNGKIYAIGGNIAVQAPIPTIEEYDPLTDTWTKKASVLAKRSSATSVVNGKIYVIGGSDCCTVLKTVEEYDPIADTMSRKADMPLPFRIRFAVSSMNGKIYVIGGDTKGRGESTVEEYDSVTDTWKKKASMPTPRGRLSTSVVNGKIYAIGGYDKRQGGPHGPLSAVEEYDPVTDKWTWKADMPMARAGLSSCVVNGKIYAVGGRTTADDAPPNITSVVEEYNPVTDTWVRKSDMPIARYWLSINAVNGKIYAIGGTTTPTWPVPTPVSLVEEYDLGLVGEGIGVGVESRGKLVTAWGKIKSKY